VEAARVEEDRKREAKKLIRENRLVEVGGDEGMGWGLGGGRMDRDAGR
jgi:hypothetical protein